MAITCLKDYPQVRGFPYNTTTPHNNKWYFLCACRSRSCWISSWVTCTVFGTLKMLLIWMCVVLNCWRRQGESKQLGVQTTTWWLIHRIKLHIICTLIVKSLINRNSKDLCPFLYIWYRYGQILLFIDGFCLMML